MVFNCAAHHDSIHYNLSGTEPVPQSVKLNLCNLRYLVADQHFLHTTLHCMQILDPAKFHSTVLKERGSDNVVQVVEQPLFDTVYVPATMQLSKEVFAAEGSGTVTQGLALKGNNIAFKGFGESITRQFSSKIISQCTGCSG